MGMFDDLIPDGSKQEAPAATPSGAGQKQAARMFDGLRPGDQAKANGESAPGLLKGMISTMQGPAMGFADELAGVGGAITGVVANLTPYGDGKSFAQNYRDTRDAARAASESHLKENPVLGHVERIAASLPVIAATPAVQAAQRTGLVASVLPESVKAGVKYGTVAGLGESNAEDAKGMATDALIAGGISGIAGPVISGAMRGTSAVARNVGQQVASTQAGRNILAAANNAAQGVGNSITQASQVVGSRIADGAGGIRDGVANAVAGGGGRAGGLVAAALSGADGNPRRFAMEKVAEALERDKAGVADPLNRAAARIGKLGDEATVADAGGQNTKQLLDTLATLPGQTKDAAERMIRNRQAGRGSRLIEAAEAGLGTNGARLSGTLEALDMARREAAAPLYERVRNASIPHDQKLSSILQRADSALGQAKQLAKINGEKFTLGEDGQVVDALMNRKQNAIPLQQLDTLKRTLYDLEQGHVNPETGRLNEIGNAYKNLRRDLVGYVDRMTTDPKTGESFYKAARDAYAGPSELRAAANLGNQAMSKDAWKIAELTDGLSPGELEAFRVGAFESLRKKFGTEGGQTQILKMWKEPGTSEKLKELFGNERAYREFASSVAKEARLKGLESVGRGSQTAARAAGMGDLDMAAVTEAGNAARSAATGNLTGLLSSAANAWNRVKTPESVRDEMGNILMAKGHKGAQRIDEIKSIARQVREERERKAAQAGKFAGLL